MVVIALSGGLGNQLFQVAAGLFVRQSRTGRLWIDARFLREHRVPRASVISAFRVPYRPVGAILHLLIRAIRKISDYSGTLRILSANPIWTFLKDPEAGRMAVLERRPRSLLTVLQGYWQLSSLVDVLGDTVTSMVKPAGPLSGRAEALRQEIASKRALAVHVRRGDYVSDPLANQVQGVCPADYYERGVAFVRERTVIDAVYVFSDDLDWAKTNLDFGPDTFFVNQDHLLSDVEEFFVMQKCTHYVVSNSTFSWWAARVAPQADKIVVAPAAWFAIETEVEKGLLPDDWYRL